jgi:hypothetical protein
MSQISIFLQSCRCIQSSLWRFRCSPWPLCENFSFYLFLRFFISLQEIMRELHHIQNIVYLSPFPYTVQAHTDTP